MHHGSLIARADLRMAAALDLFARFRDKAAFRKPPATAELIAWIQMLAVMGGEGVADVSRSLRDESMMRKSLSVLFKTYEDLKPAEAVIKQWLSDQSK
jgi:hypothetical protein